MVLIECLIGGTRLVFSLPAYVVLGMAAMLTLARRPNSDGKPSFVCFGVTGVFFGYVLVRAALSPVTYLWWPDFYMVLGCLIVYLTTAVYLTGAPERGRIIAALMALAIIEVFIGLRQFTEGDNWMPFGFIRADSGRRASGMLISSIHLAGYLEVVALFALSYAIWSTWKTWARIFAGYIAVMCYLGVAITGSRGGYLSVLFSLLVFVVMSLQAYRRCRPGKFTSRAALVGITAVLAVGLAIVLMGKSDLLRSRLSLIPQQLEKNRLDVRIYNWQAALDQFRTSPTFGTGAGTHVYYGRFYRRPQIQTDPIHAHSDYLELLAEYGIVGAVGMAAFLLIHLRGAWRNYQAVIDNELHDLPTLQPARHDGLALGIGSISAVSAYLAHSVVDFNLHVPGHALIFAFIFGVMSGPSYGSAGWKNSRSSDLIRLTLPALGLWVMISGLPKFAGEYWAEKARVAFRDYDFGDSVAYAEKSLSYEKRNPEVYFNLGGAYRGAGFLSEEQPARVTLFETAVIAYQNGLTHFPQDEHLLIRLAETLDDLGRFKEAENAYRAAIALDGNLGRIHAYYAKHLAVVGRAEEAEEAFAKGSALAQGDNIRSIVAGTSLDPAANEQ